ncbi:hypothetical protein P7C70_g5519, partial [Phenoliferia sp. Uapishka_3]
MEVSPPVGLAAAPGSVVQDLPASQAQPQPAANTSSRPADSNSQEEVDNKDMSDEYGVDMGMDVDPVLEELARWEPVAGGTSSDESVLGGSRQVHHVPTPKQQYPGIVKQPDASEATRRGINNPAHLAVVPPSPIATESLSHAGTNGSNTAKNHIKSHHDGWRDPSILIPIPRRHAAVAPATATTTASQSPAFDSSSQFTEIKTRLPLHTFLRETPRPDLVSEHVADHSGSNSSKGSDSASVPIPFRSSHPETSSNGHVQPLVAPPLSASFEATSHAQPAIPETSSSYSSSSISTIASSPLIITHHNPAPIPLLSPLNENEQAWLSNDSFPNKAPRATAGAGRGDAPIQAEAPVSIQSKGTMRRPNLPSDLDQSLLGREASSSSAALVLKDLSPASLPSERAASDDLMDLDRPIVRTSSLSTTAGVFPVSSITQPLAHEASAPSHSSGNSTLLHNAENILSIPVKQEIRPSMLSKSHSPHVDVPAKEQRQLPEAPRKSTINFLLDGGDSASSSASGVTSRTFVAPDWSSSNGVDTPPPPARASSHVSRPSSGRHHSRETSSSTSSTQHLAPTPRYGLNIPAPVPSFNGVRPPPSTLRSAILTFVPEVLVASSVRTRVSGDVKDKVVSDYGYHATDEEYAVSKAEAIRKGKGKAVDSKGYAGKPWSAYGFGPLPRRPVPEDGMERDDSPPLMSAIVDRRKKEYRDMVLAKKKVEDKVKDGAEKKKPVAVQIPVGQQQVKPVEKEVVRLPPKPPVVKVKIPTRFKKAISACRSSSYVIPAFKVLTTTVLFSAFFPHHTNREASTSTAFGPRKPGSLSAHPKFVHLLTRPDYFLEPSQSVSNTAPPIAALTNGAVAPIAPTPPPPTSTLPLLIIPAKPVEGALISRRASTSSSHSTRITDTNQRGSPNDDSDDEDFNPSTTKVVLGLKRSRGSKGRGTSLSHEYVDSSEEEGGESLEKPLVKKSKVAEGDEV